MRLCTLYFRASELQHLRAPTHMTHFTPGHVTTLSMLGPISRDKLGLETSGFRHSIYNKPLFPIVCLYNLVTLQEFAVQCYPGYKLERNANTETKCDDGSKQIFRLSYETLFLTCSARSN